MTAPTAPAPRRLGKLPHRHDDRTLRIGRYLTGPTLPDPPPAPYTPADGATFEMFGNDTAGDCAIVAPFNQIRANQWIARKLLAELATDQAIALYRQLSGYDPATGANDTGLAELDVLKLWRSAGLAGHTIEAFAAVDADARRQVRQCIALFGGLYIGAALPRSAEAQLDAGKPWTLTRGHDATPGSWGGHAMYAAGYLDAGVLLATWGQVQLASWAWWERYVDEAWAVITSDWLDATGTSPGGFDVAALRADLHTIG
jgi:hypothetical protein